MPKRNIITAEALARNYKPFGDLPFKGGDRVVNKYVGVPMDVIAMRDGCVYCVWNNGDYYLQNCFAPEDLELAP